MKYVTPGFPSLSTFHQHDSMLGGTQPLKSDLVQYCEHGQPD
jgi:hypothetical protein